MSTTDYKLERGLPASVDAEKAILGAILLDNKCFDQAAELLQASDFFLDSHRRIFIRMTELSEKSLGIDVVSLAEVLGQAKELESIGGVMYLSSLTDSLPRVRNVRQYCDTIREKSLLRQLIHSAGSLITQAYESGPANDVLRDAESAIFSLTEQRVKTGFSTPAEIAKQSFGSIDKLFERGGRITGLETHLEGFDDMTCGLQKGDLIIVAARPSMGKTALCINIAEEAAIRDQKVVAVFSLEMSKESLLMRMLASQGRVCSHKLRTGFLSREDKVKLMDALSTLTEAPIFIDDTASITPMEIRAKCRRLKQSQGRLDLAIIDYVQLCSAGKRSENRQQEVSLVSRSLKALAKELQCPVIALSQLSREPEKRTGNHRPMLSDLRESGSLEQDADVVAFIYREEVYKQDDPDLEGKAELILAKSRNGPTGTVHLAFIKSSTRFENLAREFGGPY